MTSDIEAVSSAIENAFRYDPDQDPDVYISQMLLIERHCASAVTTISVLIGNTATTIDVEQTAWELVKVIGPDIRTFCERASPVGTDRIMAFDAWLESVNDDDWFLHHGDALEAIGTESGKAMGGLSETIRRGEYASCNDVVFLHTGGMASLPVYGGVLPEAAHSN